MTVNWSGARLAEEIGKFAPNAVVGHDDTSVRVAPDSLLEVAEQLKTREEFRFDLLSDISGVDYIDHYEVVYHLLSLPRNARAVVKVRTGEGRAEPVVPSVVSVWRGADFQERETWDLMGIRFEGHPNLKRIMLWEGFPGHPLRKDFVTYDQAVAQKSAGQAPSGGAAAAGE